MFLYRTPHCGTVHNTFVFYRMFVIHNSNGDRFHIYYTDRQKITWSFDLSTPVRPLIFVHKIHIVISHQSRWNLAKIFILVQGRSLFKLAPIFLKFCGMRSFIHRKFCYNFYRNGFWFRYSSWKLLVCVHLRKSVLIFVEIGSDLDIAALIYVPLDFGS